MPLIKVKDLNFYYEFHGEGEPLVLISGTGFSCEHWKVFQVPDLSKHFRVLIWDHRGTGRSDKPEVHYSTRMFAEDCANLMKALNIGKDDNASSGVRLRAGLSSFHDLSGIDRIYGLVKFI